MTVAPPRTSPPKRNAAASRARILQAAQDAFSTTGYSHTGIRDIAKLAGVSSTLLVRYFGSKAQLFEEAIKASMRASETVQWERSDYGRNLADALLDPANEFRGPIMIALASGDPESAGIAARIANRHGMKILADWLGGDAAEERTLAIAMMSTGYVIYARQLPMPAAAELANLREWFIATVNRLISGKGWKD
ncbi:MAG: TetR family transcriptional regulator [Novosphingobium sp.]